MDILSVGCQPHRDDNIIKQQFHSYSPYTSSFENNDEIRIAVQSQDLYVLPSESYIFLEVDVSRKTGTQHEDVVGRWGTNHASFLFSEIRYELNGTEIDRTKNVGLSSILKMCTAIHESDCVTSKVMCIFTSEALAVRTYQFIIPLKLVLGFCDDYRKIIMNAKHELVLIRNRKDIYSYVANTESFNIKVRKIQWKMPHVTLADHAKLALLRHLEKKQSISIAYRSWDLCEMPQLPQTSRHIWTVKSTTQICKPRFVLVAFQTNALRVEVNSGSVDHCNISDVKLFLNSEFYPYDNFNLDFGNSKAIELFLAYLRMQKVYYDGPQCKNPFELSYETFLSSPIFTFDCTRSDESMFGGVVDVRLEINARENIPNNTSAHCLIIHDNQVEYSPFSSIVLKNA